MSDDPVIGHAAFGPHVPGAVFHLDDRRELNKLKAENRELRELVLTLLEAPYEGLVPWARTLACGRLKHPQRSDGKCFCDRSRVLPNRESK